MSVFAMSLWLEFWACQIQQNRFDLFRIPFLSLEENKTTDKFIKHVQECVLRVQAIVLHVFHTHVLCSKCPQHKPQQHFEVQSCCGSSFVGVGVQNVLVVSVLGMSD